MKIRKIVDINELSFFLLVLPYLGFNWISLYQSPFFNFVNLFALLIIILSIDLIIKKIFCTYSRNKKVAYGFILIIILLFFYGNYFSLIAQKFIFDFTNVFIRGRTIFLFIACTLLILKLFLLKVSNLFKYLNIFLIIFSLINFLGSSKVSQNSHINEIKSSYKLINLKEKTIKPVILLIIDEYSSPDELFKIYKDSSVYDFSIHLKNKNWVVRNVANTNETSTIHSLSSLFNFNVSEDKKYSNYNVFEIGPSKLMNAAIYDSLFRKKIEVINFGIFNIGPTVPLSSFYFFPKNFFDQFFFNSSLRTIIDNTDGLKFIGFKNSYYPTDILNQFILEDLVDSLKSLDHPRIFTYAHLYMPHAPMKFRSEFKITSRDNLVNYTSFWVFTNKKLKNLLLELIKGNKYRIILSGDHGYRKDKRINPNKTFMAFYGFDEKDLTKIYSVQDLGSLVNACYKYQ